MRTILRMLTSVRWAMLLFVVPPALLWGLTMDHTGGWIAIATLACITGLWGALLDAHFLQMGEDPRLALRENRDHFALEGVLALRTLLGAASIVLSIVLLFVAPTMGIAAVVGLAILLLMTLLDAGRVRRRRFWLSELIVPVALVGVPLAMASLSARGAIAARIQSEEALDPETARTAIASIEAIPIGVLEGAILFGITLGVIVLLMLLRDQAKDAGEGYQTTPTLLGREAGSALLTIALIGGVTVACVGVAGGLWHWLTPVAIAGGSMGVIWLHAYRADGAAAFLWMLTQAVGAGVVLDGVL